MLLPFCLPENAPLFNLQHTSSRFWSSVLDPPVFMKWNVVRDVSGAPVISLHKSCKDLSD